MTQESPTKMLLLWIAPALPKTCAHVR